MKISKIIAVISLVLIFSCANDETATDKFNIETAKNSDMIAKTTADIDTMFSEYVNSDEFIARRKATKEFNIDLNFKGNFANIKSEQDLFTWIRNNLPETTFLNIEDAQSRWDSLVQLKETEYKKFPNINQFISNNPIETVTPYLHKWLIPSYTVTSNCERNFDSCVNKATNTYASRVAAIASAGYNAMTLSFLGVVDMQFDIDIDRCAFQYENCIEKE
ncbi:hypothetical protein AS589_12170 [Empedobacter brevis]|uniref:hypothetical protein n=1 Tax=Empedobacter brevis TaxID=247 RepID=UPI001320278F|nr:hypothetical protein [Empedobacter brevis]QHC85483.1 hypothetical protein AS589_12170 [Empedobacter brevis]